MFIFLLSPNKKKKKLHSTRVYQTRVLCNLFIYFIFFFKKKVLEPGILEYCVNCTQVYQPRVPQNFFNRTNPTQQCHGGKTNEELKFLKCSRKSGTLLFISETMFFC